VRRIPLIVLTAALGLVCAAVVLSAASVTRYLLSMDAARIRLLNYQISSRVLEERFVTEEMNLDQELQGHILESTVLNFDRFLASPGILEQAGVAMLNAIRFATQKPPLALEQDEANIRQLQVGFQLERHKRIREAAIVFENLESRLTGDDRAFILLHSGYCQFLLGSEKEARARVTRVISEFPGTHFARSASIILDALDARAAEEGDGLRRAEELYRNRRFEAARRLYAQAGRLQPEQAYRYARTLEETGKIQESSVIYRQLAESSSAVQTQAVRRLLVLGVLLDAGPEVAEYARRKSEELGDTALGKVDQARTVAADVRVIGEKPNPVIRSLAPPPPAEKAEPEAAKTVEIESAPRKPEPAKRAPAIEPKTRMVIQSRGGETWTASSMVVYGESAVLLPGGGIIKLDDIESIDAGAGALRLNQADIWTRSLKRQGSGFLTAERAFIPAQALREIRVRD
jgi:tetratricopeptide (TPR) repeat protein